VLRIQASKTAIHTNGLLVSPAINYQLPLVAAGVVGSIARPPSPHGAPNHSTHHGVPCIMGRLLLFPLDVPLGNGVATREPRSACRSQRRPAGKPGGGQAEPNRGAAYT
jgi:hypothetical protein